MVPMARMHEAPLSQVVHDFGSALWRVLHSCTGMWLRPLKFSPGSQRDFNAYRRTCSTEAPCPGSNPYRIGVAVLIGQRRSAPTKVTFPKAQDTCNAGPLTGHRKDLPVRTWLHRTVTRATIAVGAVAALTVGMAAPTSAANGLPDLTDPLAYYKYPEWVVNPDNYWMPGTDCVHFTEIGRAHV